ncbi:MAG: D-amino acid aminotransferase [Spirochaetaceae bacterium]
MLTSPRHHGESTIVYLSGRYLPKGEALISPDDRGFLFADGVYEVLRFYDGRFFLLEEHLARLAHSMEAIRLSPGPDQLWPSWTDVFDELVSRNGLTGTDGFVYLQVTRGAAPRSHAFPPPSVPPTMYAYVWEHPRSADDRRRHDGVAAITYPDRRWGRCDIKSVALLPNVLAQQAAVDRGAYEAILCRQDGPREGALQEPVLRDDAIVTEGSHSSLFMVRHGEVRTHPLNEGVLPGITRSFVVELAEEANVGLREEIFTLRELQTADEAFLTGTGSEIAPVVRLDHEPVGSGTPGPITRRLQTLFEDRVATFRRFARDSRQR